MTAERAHMSMVTLGVADLDSSEAFYVELGWKRTPHSQESVRFLQGRNIVLGLYGRGALAEDAGLADKPTGFAATAFAVNLDSPAAVDAYFAMALQAGAEAVKKPEKVFWGGYSGYFADSDGHLWEVAHNPFFPVDPNGDLDLLAEPDA